MTEFSEHELRNELLKGKRYTAIFCSLWNGERIVEREKLLKDANSGKDELKIPRDGLYRFQTGR